jgi:hypothetical protein
MYISTSKHISAMLTKALIPVPVIIFLFNICEEIKKEGRENY